MSLAARSIVIGPVCNGRAHGRAACDSGSVTTITRKCVHRSSPLNYYLLTYLLTYQTGSIGEGSDHLQLIAVLRPWELRRGEFFWLRLTTASAQCLRLSERFFRFFATASGGKCIVLMAKLSHFKLFILF